jgi:ribosomal protein S18 acetylase RimI-like enzyme
MDLDELIGRRVALRYRMDQSLMTDAVGDLAESANAAEVIVYTRTGPVIVPRRSVVAVRGIPPPRPRRPSLAAVTRLENICADAWPPLVSERLGQWRLRAADGFTGRANSALVAGDAGVPLPEALDRVRLFAAEHDLAPRIQVPTSSPWHRAITEQGWRLDSGHAAGANVVVMVGEVAGLASGLVPDGVRTRIDTVPTDRWWELSSVPPMSAGQRQVLRGANLPSTGFGLVWIKGVERAVGAVRLAALDEHLYVSTLIVLSEHRKLGLATALLDAAARWGVTQARWVVLQVAEHNTAAISLYQRFGMREHHRYEYLIPHSSSSPRVTSLAHVDVLRPQGPAQDERPRHHAEHDQQQRGQVPQLPQRREDRHQHVASRSAESADQNDHQPRQVGATGTQPAAGAQATGGADQPRVG